VIRVVHKRSLGAWFYSPLILNKSCLSFCL
jgi:hypothetical protein